MASLMSLHIEQRNNTLPAENGSGAKRLPDPSGSFYVAPTSKTTTAGLPVFPWPTPTMFRRATSRPKRSKSLYLLQSFFSS